MHDLYPIDYRLAPPIYGHHSDIPPDATEARIVGPLADFDRPAPRRKLERLWLQNLKGDQAAQLAVHFDPVQLSLRNVQTPDLAWLSQLGRLNDLNIDWNTKLESFEFLRSCAPLARLRADGLMRIGRLDELTAQPQISSLWIGGGMDRKLRIKSLEPLAAMSALQDLSLVSMKLEQESLEPLHRLSRLTELSLQANMAPMEEYARLAGRLPDTEFDWAKGFVAFGWTLPRHVDLLTVIDQLDPDAQLLMVGKGGRRLRLGKDRKSIVAQVQRFRAIRDAEAARLTH